MSYKQYVKRGCRYILRGVPVKNITASISYLQPNNRLSGKKLVSYTHLTLPTTPYV